MIARYESVLRVERSFPAVACDEFVGALVHPEDLVGTLIVLGK